MREFLRDFPALDGDVSIAAVSHLLVDSVVISFNYLNCLLTVMYLAYSLLDELALEGRLLLLHSLVRKFELLEVFFSVDFVPDESVHILALSFNLLKYFQ